MKKIQATIIVSGLMLCVQSFVFPTEKKSALKKNVVCTQQLPLLKDLIKKEKAEAGSSRYIALFVDHCLNFNDQELEFGKENITAMPYGKTLFTIAERIRQFNQNNDSHSWLDFSRIPRIERILDNLLAIIQLLITKKIISLNLSYNNLEKIPKSIGNLLYLKNLNLIKVKLTEIPVFLNKGNLVLALSEDLPFEAFQERQNNAFDLYKHLFKQIPF